MKDWSFYCWIILQFRLVFSENCTINYFQAKTNSSLCLPCGKNSKSPDGGMRDKCVCFKGHFRPENDRENFASTCEMPPGPPMKLKVLHVSRTTHLSWEIPNNIGTGDEVKFDVECTSCIPVVKYRDKTSALNASMLLTPSVRYDFVVSSHNNVTSLLGIIPSANISFEVPLRGNESEGTNWKIILLVFLLPTLAVVFAISICQRTRYDRANKARRKREEQHEKPHANGIPMADITHIPNRKDSGYVNIDMYEIDRDSVYLERPLGEGFFGLVYKGRATNLPGFEGEVDVAVKTIKENMTDFDEDFLHELYILRNLRTAHKNVIRLLGCCTQKGPSLIVLEYLELGDLWNYLKLNIEASLDGRYVSSVSLHTKLSISQMIAEGMAHLAEHQIIHRDLACRNILLNKDLEPKISDFGLARNVENTGIYFKGPKMAKLPLFWMAPESVLKGMSTSQSDVWSFGIVLWEIFTNGDTPYPGFDSNEMQTVLKSKYRMEQPLDCPDELYDIMLACWLEDPEKRPTFNRLKELKIWSFSSAIDV